MPTISPHPTETPSPAAAAPSGRKIGVQLEDGFGQHHAFINRHGFHPITRLAAGERDERHQIAATRSQQLDDVQRPVRREAELDVASLIPRAENASRLHSCRNGLQQLGRPLDLAEGERLEIQ